MNMIRKIDIHAHVRPKGADPKKGMALAEEVLKVYDDIGVEMGGILPFLRLGEDPGVLTWESARAESEAHAGRFFWYTTVDVCRPLPDGVEWYDFLKAQKELGARGVGEITTKVYADDARLEALLDCCEHLELPVLFHMAANFDAKYGVVDDMGLPRLENILKRHPKLYLIGHARPFWSEISRMENEKQRDQCSKEKVTEGRLSYLLRKYDHLYCDLSAQSGANAMMRDREYAAQFMTEFQDRILYGCDICTTASTYPYEFAEFLDDLCRDGCISRTVYEKICRENAIRLFHL